jgi:hypothetical protein
MAKLTYVGPHDAVEVALPGGVFVLAERGKPVEIDDADVAKSLEQQDVWEAAKKKGSD